MGKITPYSCRNGHVPQSGFRQSACPQKSNTPGLLYSGLSQANHLTDRIPRPSGWDSTFYYFSMAEFRNVRAVVLAGVGHQALALSRLQAPAKFPAIDGDETLLEATVSRLAPTIDKSQGPHRDQRGNGRRRGLSSPPAVRKDSPNQLPGNTAPAIGVTPQSGTS